MCVQSDGQGFDSGGSGGGGGTMNPPPPSSAQDRAKKFGVDMFGGRLDLSSVRGRSGGGG